jgi:hypothetical protein
MKHELTTAAATMLLTLGLFTGYRALADVKQPHMESALHHLEEAKEQLQMAEHDKDGHREKALEITEHAMEEVKAGMQYADKK